ncbi:MAG: efflux RND transporter periplasmic adaptor subunit [Pseudomonadota bacterium]
MMSSGLSRLKNRVGSLAALTLLLTVVVWVLQEPAQTKAAPIPDGPGLTVTIVTARPLDAQIDVTAVGATQARWATAITSSVSGRVTSVSPTAIPGRLVQKEEVLASLQDSFFRSELSAAHARVSVAELELAETLNRQHVARKSSVAKSAYGRFEPHVETAVANRDAAIAALKAEQQRFDDTRVKAPFDAVVTSDHAHPGQWVNVGDVLFRVAASEFLDVKVELSETSWQRLKSTRDFQDDLGIEGFSWDDISIVAPGGQRWPATFRYLNPVVEPLSRQRSVMLEVNRPYQGEAPLLPGQQVDVVFGGVTQPFVVNAPASVLTDDGRVWSVANSSLRLERIELLEERPDAVLFRYQNNPEQQRQLVLFPLASFLEGQTVTATTP